MIYKSLGELIQAVQNQIKESVQNDNDILEDFLKDIVQIAVIQEVYDAYNPETYDRRLDNGGLGDKDNIRITQVEFRNEGAMITVENLTKGADSSSSSLFTSHLIEYGAIANQMSLTWDMADGDWAEPRPFMKEALSDLQGASNAELRHVVKQMFMRVGWKFK